MSENYNEEFTKIEENKQMKVYDITIYTNILTKEQIKHIADLFVGRCGVDPWKDYANNITEGI